MAVHLSIHDVSPAAKNEIELALETCAEFDAKPALLVVPNFHGAWPLTDDPKFCARLRDLQARGHEVYLHGFFHRSGAAPPPAATGRSKLKWVFAQRITSNGESEFRDVTPAEAEQRLDEGEAVLRAAGLRIDGFVAPAWGMPLWLLPILAKRNYRFTEDHLRVYDPARHLQRPSVVLNYASRSPARLISTVAYCRVAKFANRFMPTRIAIHPADMRYSLLRHEVRALLKWGRGSMRGDWTTRGTQLLE